MKKIFLLIAAVLMVSCVKPLEKQVKMVSIPYSLTSTITKASYAGNVYSLKETDKLYIKGINRDDISATLLYDNNSWQGDLYYNEYEGEPSIGEELSVLVIHGANADTTTYSNQIVDNSLQYAIENYSKFASTIGFGDNSVTLNQTSCFIETTIHIEFVGVGKMTEGETSIEVNSINGISNISKVTDNQYVSNFIIVIPGNTEISQQSVIKVCDREISMINNSVILLPNKKYTLDRTIQFKPELGDPYWSDGTYGRISHGSGIDITGIIVYVNNDDSDVSLAVTESANGAGHALVMALHNSDTRINWGGTTLHSTQVTKPSETLLDNTASGYSNTLNETGCTAAESAKNYRSDQNDDHSNDTGWFLPSVGQWIYSLSDFAKVDPVENWTNGSNKKWITQGNIERDLVYVREGPADANLLVKYLNERFEVLENQFGCSFDRFGIMVYDETKSKYVNSDSYWTSSEYSAANAIRFNLGSVESRGGKYYSTFKVAYITKSSTHAWKTECPLKVRPFLAF